MLALKKHKKKFIKFPTLGGGREILIRMLKDNLVYPPEAQENKIEGNVLIEYQVNNLGEVIDARVVHGIGFGCDEEALRLVKLIKYQEVKNRGLKVTTKNRIKIPFHLKEQTGQAGITVTYLAGKGKSEMPEASVSFKKKTYTYSIRIHYRGEETDQA